MLSRTMGFDLDQKLVKEWHIAAAYLVWAIGVALFAAGMVTSYPADGPDSVIPFLTLVTLAEAACLWNFSQKRSPRNAITIAQISAWALASWLQSKGFINDTGYAIATAAFVLSVIYTVQKPDPYAAKAPRLNLGLTQRPFCASV